MKGKVYTPTEVLETIVKRLEGDGRVVEVDGDNLPVPIIGVDGKPFGYEIGTITWKQPFTVEEERSTAYLNVDIGVYLNGKLFIYSSWAVYDWPKERRDVQDKADFVVSRLLDNFRTEIREKMEGLVCKLVCETEQEERA